MRRRDLIALLGGSVLVGPQSGFGQEPKAPARIGVLIPYAQTDPETQARVATFMQGLQDFGWVESRNIHIEFRWAAGDQQRIRAYAKELVDLKPNLIFAVTTPVTAALQRETQSIPVVFAVVSDPVGSGFVKSLAQPEGNITGFINIESSLGAKWLELLKEVAPAVTRAAMIFNPDTATYASYYLRPFETAASSFGVEPIVAPIRNEAEIERVISSLGRSPDGGLIVMTDASTLMHRKPIISLTAHHKVPAVYPSRYMVPEGALLSYGIDNLDLFRRAAGYVDRILRGAKPSELPVQVPSKFEMAVNLKTARALGLTIPPSVLVRADEVIE